MSTLKLVIPIDFSNASIEAIHYASKLTSKGKDELILVHVLDKLSSEEAKGKLDEIAKSELESFNGEIRTAVIPGDVEDHIGSFADKEKANFIVMGIHEQSLLDSLLGSRAMDVIAYSKTPFITVQEGTDFVEIDKIAMTIDLDTDSVQVVKAAAALANNFGAELLLVAGDHTDENFKRKIKTNLTVARNYLDKQKITSSIELIDRDDYTNSLLKLCDEKGVDIISATYYLKTFGILSTKFVQRLISNSNKLPVLTVDAQIFTSGPKYPFITT
jgi:nucleotide-binding universal stress UspA family protein